MPTILQLPNEVLEVITAEMDLYSLLNFINASKVLRSRIALDIRGICLRNQIYRRAGESWANALRRAPYRTLTCPESWNHNPLFRLHFKEWPYGINYSPFYTLEPPPFMRTHGASGMTAILDTFSARIRNLDQNIPLNVEIRTPGVIFRAGFTADGEKFVIQHRVFNPTYWWYEGNDIGSAAIDVVVISTRTWEVIKKHKFPDSQLIHGDSDIIYDESVAKIYNLRTNEIHDIDAELNAKISIFLPGRYVQIPMYDYHPDGHELACFPLDGLRFAVYDFGKRMWRTVEAIECPNPNVDPEIYSCQEQRTLCMKLDAYRGELTCFSERTCTWQFIRIADGRITVLPESMSINSVIFRDNRTIIDPDTGMMAFDERGNLTLQVLPKGRWSRYQKRVPISGGRENLFTTRDNNRYFLLQNRRGTYTVSALEKTKHPSMRTIAKNVFYFDSDVPVKKIGLHGHSEFTPSSIATLRFQNIDIRAVTVFNDVRNRYDTIAKVWSSATHEIRKSFYQFIFPFANNA